MPSVCIVGMGPGPVELLTKAAEAELLAADKIYSRLSGHPVFHWLRDRGKNVVSFDALYGLGWESRQQLYDFIAKAVLQEAAFNGRAVYAVPGSPFVLEETTRLLRLQGPSRGIDIEVRDGMSFSSRHSQP